MALLNEEKLINSDLGPFAAYGIDHLSPSTCNTFVNSPALFVMQKCMGLKTPVGTAAHRGTAVEAGVAHGLVNPDASVAECAALAQERFDALAALSTDNKKDKERAGLAGMVEQGLLALRPYGVPSSLQASVSIAVPGCSVPLVGFSDFEWKQHGIGVDLKTTHAVPSEISTHHARQGALYKAASGWRECRFAYCSAKRSAVYLLENADEHLEALFKICRAIERFLSISEDPNFLASIVMPDVDSFYFSDALARQNALTVFGI